MSPRVPALLGGAPAYSPGLPLARPMVPDQDRVLARIAEVLASGRLTNADTVRELEAEVADRCGVRNAIAVSSCTAGLMLSYRVLGVAGRVVMPSMTFAASAHAVVWAGGTPAWADVDTDSGAMDVDDAARLVEGAAAISATHVYGTPCDVDRLEGLARRTGLPLVLDAAHALGARHGDRAIGSFGTVEVFSMSPTKVAVAGEGGMVTTDDDGLADALRIGRDYGNPGTYDCQFVGLNARMSELHAALGVASVRHLDDVVARRNELVDGFVAALAAEGVPGVRRSAVRPGDVSTWKDLTVLVDASAFGLSAPQLARVLAAEGVDTRRYFDPPCHRQKAYADVPPEHDLLGTDAFTASVLALPLHTTMDDDVLPSLARLLRQLHERAADLRHALDDR